MQEILLKGYPIGSINGILFDKDGTLVNSEEYLLYLSRLRLSEAKKKLKEYGYSEDKVYSIEQLLYKAYGIDTNGIKPNGLVAIASSKDNLVSTATIFCLINGDWSKSFKIANEVFSIASKKASFVDSSKKKNKLLPGVKSIIRKSYKRNIKIGIISNDTRDGIKSFLKDNKLEKEFIHFWSSEDFPPKPNPQSVKEICKLMDLHVSECALIGDSNADIEMARNSGVKIALGYTGGWKQSPSLYEYHHLIHHWEDLNFQDSSKMNFLK